MPLPLPRRAGARLLVLLLASLSAVPHVRAGEAARPIEIPFRYHRYLNPGPVVQVRVNGDKPLSFLLDTGCPYPILLSPATCKELGLTPGEREVRIAGLTGKLVRLGSVQIVGPEAGRDTDLKGLPEAFVTDLSPMQPVYATRIAGVLGLPLLSRFRAELDYERGQVTLFPASEPFQPPAGAVEVALTRDEHFWMDVEIAPGVKERFVVDTGATATTVRKQVAERAEPLAADLAGTGSLYGTTEAAHLLLPSVRLGRHSEPRVALAAAAVPQSLLGNDLLSRFRVTLDFPRRKAYLLRAKDYAERARLDGDSVVSLRKEGEHFTVLESALPPQELPVQTGDRIVEVDGAPLAGISEAAAQSLLRGAAGTDARVVLLREGRRREVTWKRPGTFDFLADPKAASMGIREIRLDEEGRPTITRMRAATPGWKAGLRVGDRILQVNGKTLQGLPEGELAQALGSIRTGGVTLAVRQPGEPQRSITLAPKS